jgi:hypothetical protein
MRGAAPWLAGLLLTGVVHGAVALAFIHGVGPRGGPSLQLGAKPQRPASAVLCDGRRCPRLEVRRKRRAPEDPPITEPEVLEAAMIPALGSLAPDPSQLPEIETIETPEVFEDRVNLDQAPSRLDKIVTRDEARAAMRDPLNRSPLDKLLNEERPDPRARAKDLARLTGYTEGEVGGQGTEVRLGNLYASRVAREISKVFRVPPFLDPARLRKLQLRIRVERMASDGSVTRYKVESRSADRTFDDAALAAFRQFVPLEGGTRNLPQPEPDVLRFINARGLLIKLDGSLLPR